jgi:hypothetical protein
MPKDPAALFYIDTWLVATAEMKSDCRGWYLNLILHQYDKKDLPSDLEELATLANVRVSEFEKFKDCWQQVLQHKFKQNANGRLENGLAAEILRSREQFKDERSKAGKMSVFVKFIRANLCQDENAIFFIKKNVDLTHVDVNNQHLLKQVFEQMFQLYINGNGNKNTNGFKEGGTGETKPAEPVGIVPEMLQEFKTSNPDYPADQTTDFPALREIATKILKWEKLRGDITEPNNADVIKRRWGDLVPFVRAHQHYSGYSLSQVNKHFQSIAQSFNNAPAPTNQSNFAGGNPKPAGTSTARNERLKAW